MAKIIDVLNSAVIIFTAVFLMVVAVYGGWKLGVTFIDWAIK